MNSIQISSSLFHILFPFNNILTRPQRFEIQTFFAKKNPPMYSQKLIYLHFSNEIHPLSLFLHRNPPTRRQILGWGNLQWAEGRRKVKTIFLAKQKKIQPKDNVSTRVIIIDPVRGSLYVQSYLAISIVWGYWGRFEHPPSVWNFRCAECVAIGECGLDFNRNFSPPEVQIEVFEKQVILIWMMIRNIIKIMSILIMKKIILMMTRCYLLVNWENLFSCMSATLTLRWSASLKGGHLITWYGNQWLLIIHMTCWW